MGDVKVLRVVEAGEQCGAQFGSKFCALPKGHDGPWHTSPSGSCWPFDVPTRELDGPATPTGGYVLYSVDNVPHVCGPDGKVTRLGEKVWTAESVLERLRAGSSEHPARMVREAFGDAVWRSYEDAARDGEAYRLGTFRVYQTELEAIAAALNGAGAVVVGVDMATTGADRSVVAWYGPFASPEALEAFRPPPWPAWLSDQRDPYVAARIDALLSACETVGDGRPGGADVSLADAVFIAEMIMNAKRLLSIVALDSAARIKAALDDARPTQTKGGT